MLQINIPLTALAAILVIGLIIYLIYKNIKDKKKYEKEKIQSEIKPDKHDGDHI
ncbi:hypothetical protein D3C87_1762170 [compost metagenome]|jgi:F0F1-type ATP synthase membrane subunit b/b'|uniref:hypothetical protein n=1 Tax=Pedobacter sp. ASV1-7 TaxID=3145237 RepID=UPI000FB6806C